MRKSSTGKRKGRTSDNSSARNKLSRRQTKSWSESSNGIQTVGWFVGQFWSRMRNDGRIGWQTLRVNYGSKSSIKVNYDPAASQMILGRGERRRWRNVAWRGEGQKIGFLLTTSSLSREKSNLHFLNSDTVREEFFPLYAKGFVPRFILDGKRMKFSPWMRNNPIKHSSSASVQG